MELIEAAPRILVATLLGAAIGFERQWRQRMAGLRTNALVALGAASFVVFSLMIENEISPTRVAAQVVSGIGFLGAGVIMREGLNIRGLNTAATLWCSAAVGVFCGAGLLGPGAVAASMVLLVNGAVRPMMQWIDKSPRGATETDVGYSVSVRCPAEREAYVRALLLHSFGEGGLVLSGMDSHDENQPGVVKVEARLRGPVGSNEALEKVVGRLSLEPFVSAARWQVEESPPWRLFGPSR